MIAIIDYGMGNLRSVQKAFESVGGDAKITAFPEDIDSADKIVFPGVGSFKDGMAELTKRGLLDSILSSIGNKKPFMGLCLGFQMLFTESEEGGVTKGFDVLKGKVTKFPQNRGLKVPHMGWNRIDISSNRKCPILEGIPDGAYMYFVHSYFVEPVDKNIISAFTEYGIEFASIIWQDNIYATQFHPEKSQELGLKILENFTNL